MAGLSLVSFLLPVYNASSTVEQAINSVLGQRNAPPLELVVINDGSTDGTLELLEKLARTDPRIRLISTARQGQVAAAVTAQAQCHGDFIARMDADDISHPDRVAAQLALLEREPQLGIVGSRVRYFPRKRLRAGLLHYEKWLNSLLAERDSVESTHAGIVRELFVECPLANPSLMFRREAFEEVGGYRDFHGLPEDYDLVFRFAESGWRLGGVPRVLHRWRDHQERVSRTDARYSEESFRKLKLHYLKKLRLEDGSHPVLICGAGPVGKTWLKAFLTEGIQVRYLVEVNPRKIGKKIHGVPVVRAEDLPAPGDTGLILGAVGQKGARDNIRANLDPLGYCEGEDYIFIA